MGRLRIKRGEGKRWLRRQDFRLSDEVRYIQRRAAQYDCRIVSIGPVLLFSTESGDAWMLDPVGELATAIARQGEALPVHIERHESQLHGCLDGKLPNRRRTVPLPR